LSPKAIALGRRMKCQALPSVLIVVFGAAPVAPWIKATRPINA
jgi:hypothetical protein